MIAKVADFGLTQDIYVADYYRIGHSTPLPVKWLAPEALIDRMFTTQSDVVSNYNNDNSLATIVFTYTVVIWSNMLGDIHTGTTTISYSE